MKRFSLLYDKAGILFILLLNIFFLSGCTDSQSRIVLWTSMRPVEREVLQKYLDYFSGRYPEYTFMQRFYAPEELRTNFIISTYAGKGPSLIHCASDNIGPFVELEVIQPLEPFFEESFLDRFLNTPLKANTWFQGHLYQIADRVGNHLCLVYNRDLVKIPPQSMGELIEFGQELKRAFENGQTKTRYALAWNYTEPYFVVPFITGFGGFILNEKGEPTLDTKATRNASRFIYELAMKYKVIPPESDYEIANALFMDGTSAMIINGPWSWGTYLKNGMNIGIAQIPRIDETGIMPKSLISPLGYCLNANLTGKERDMALELIRFLTSREAQLEFTRVSATIPSLKSALEDPVVKNNRLLQESLPQLLSGIPMPVFTEMRWIWDAMRPAYQGIFTGQYTPDEAAREMQSLAERLIIENRE